MYCTDTDIYEQVPGSDLLVLTNDVDPETIDDAVIVDKIQQATALINGYIRNKVKLPLFSVPLSLKTIAIDITIFLLYQRRIPSPVPESIRQSYIDAVKLLGDIQTGKFNLGIEESGGDSSVPTKTTILTNKEASDRIFNKDYLNKY